MEFKYLQRVFGILSFLTAMVVYLLTVQPTVPFWDCGEFSAAAVWQQVPHPPGTPLFLLVGKIFHLIIPFGDEGWRINLVSVVCSAVTVWLLYYIIIMVIRNFRKEPISSFAEAVAIYASGYIGAAALIFSDTFWFNAVESEVYAMSSLFVAIVVYLMMKWNEEADNPGHERYLLLIAYLMGLSTGVHLLALLAIFSIIFVVYFRKYKYSTLTFIVTAVLSVIVFTLLYPIIVKWIPGMLAGHFPFKNDCREYTIEHPLIGLLVIGTIIMAGVGLWWAYKNKHQLLSLICSAFLLMILGYTTYTQILLRSNANPPMNENEPKTLSSLTSYLGREQYGEAPNWPRRYNATDDYYISRYEKRDDQGKFVYGAWRRPARKDVECKDGRYISIPHFARTNFDGEFNFLWKYQMNHMYIRYFLWNYVGRKSDVQDAGWTFTDNTDVDRLNYESGYAHLFPIKFYALPLIFGLIGLFFHFYRDPKMAFAYLVMFLMMGIMTAIAQNQQEPQPRERDYFYAGSFFIFCLWIGLSVYAVIDLLANKKPFTSLLSAGASVLIALLVPVNMAVGGWKMHTRAGNFLPFDYSYNILQSTERDAILFTNGDNDTFPLWYLQDVAGVRRDVRVVNLSLGNTLWYIDQLKNREPWGAKKIPLSFSDDSLRVTESDSKALSYDFGEALNVRIQVKPEIIRKYTDDPEIINSGEVKFTFVGRQYTERDGKPIYLYRVQDKLVLDILRQVQYERPVYYSVTVGPDAFCGLETFFRYEGMAMRICPVPQRSATGDNLNPDIMDQCLLNIDNSENFSKEPKYGFKMRNLNNPDVYYDEVHRRLMITYRTLYLSYANWLMQNTKDSKKVVILLDTMNRYISPVQFPMTYEMEFQVAKMYADVGEKEKATTFAQMAIKSCNKLIENPDLKPELTFYEVTGRYFGPYRRLAYLYEMLEDYQSAKLILQQFHSVCQQAVATYSQSPAYQQEVDKVRNNMIDVMTNIDEMTLLDVKKKYGQRAAIDSAIIMKERYINDPNPMMRNQAMYIDRRIQDMMEQSDLMDTIQ